MADKSNRGASGKWEQELFKSLDTPVALLNADPNKDISLERDELGNDIYETSEGVRYMVGEVKRPTTIKETVKAVYDAIPPKEEWRAPTGDELVSGAKALAKGVVEEGKRLVETPTNPDASLMDLFDVASLGGTGVISRIGKPHDMSLVSAFGASHKVPSYKKKTSVKDTIRDLPGDESFDDDGFLKINEGADEDELLGVLNKLKNDDPKAFDDGSFEFINPLPSIIAEMEIPANGLKGSDLAKQLEINPSVRNSQLKSQGTLASIDPAKRYTKEEATELLSKNAYDVRAVPQSKFETYQRQYDLVDEEVDYVEYAINADPVDPNGKTFKASRPQNQHFQQNTLAHVRLSNRKGTNGEYVLIEEMQSDLLQKGFAKPGLPGDEVAAYERILGDVEQLGKIFADEDEFHLFDLSVHFTPEMLVKYKELGRRADEAINSPDQNDLIESTRATHAFFREVADELGEKSTSKITDDIDQAMYRLTSRVDEVADVIVPPIGKTKEGVRFAIDTAIAHASKTGSTKVVIPNLKKIAERRFEDDPAGFAKAMDPKSGFYATYVKALDEVVNDLKAEHGDRISVKKTQLEYDPAKKEHDFGRWEPDVVGWNENDLALNFNDNRDYFQAAEFRTLDGETLNKLDETFQTILNRQDGESIRSLLGDDLYQLQQNFFTAASDTIPNFNHITFFENIQDGLTVRDALEAFRVKTPNAKTPTVLEEATEIDFGGLSGQNLDLSKPKFAEGGAVMDPQNTEVPPGALPNEVADTVDIKASEGEYIIPANVVRFLGLDKLEKMVEQAKGKLGEMEDKGRMGNAPAEEDLPFSAEELQTADMVASPEAAPQEAPAFAAGGYVAGTGINPTLDPNSDARDPVTGLPLWMSQFQQPTTPAPVAAPTNVLGNSGTTWANTNMEQGDYNGGRERPDNTPATGLQRPRDQWSVDDYTDFVKNRDSIDGKAVKALASMMVPGAGLITKIGDAYMDRAVPADIEKALATGLDAQGNKLSPDQVKSLTEAKASWDARAKANPTGKVGGLVSGVLDKITGLISPRQATPTKNPAVAQVAKAATSKPTTKTTSRKSPETKAEGLISRRPEARPDRASVSTRDAKADRGSGFSSSGSRSSNEGSGRSTSSKGSSGGSRGDRESPSNGSSSRGSSSRGSSGGPRGDREAPSRSSSSRGSSSGGSSSSRSGGGPGGRDDRGTSSRGSSSSSRGSGGAGPR